MVVLEECTQTWEFTIYSLDISNGVFLHVIRGLNRIKLNLLLIWTTYFKQGNCIHKHNGVLSRVLKKKTHKKTKHTHTQRAQYQNWPNYPYFPIKLAPLETVNLSPVTQPWIKRQAVRVLFYGCCGCCCASVVFDMFPLGQHAYLPNYHVLTLNDTVYKQQSHRRCCSHSLLSHIVFPQMSDLTTGCWPSAGLVSEHWTLAWALPWFQSVSTSFPPPYMHPVELSGWAREGVVWKNEEEKMRRKRRRRRRGRKRRRSDLELWGVIADSI